MNAPPNLLTLEFTELGNAKRIAAKYGSILRYVRAWKTWLVWDGMRWKRDDVGIEMTCAKGIVEDLRNEAATLAKRAATENDQRLADAAALMLGWAKTSSKAAVLAASAKLAETETPIAATAAQFDANPYLLNVLNGTIDLEHDALRPPSQADMITMLAPVIWNPGAPCPVFDHFLSWMLPDLETRAWMQRFTGYCLTGDVGAQIITFLHGDGANGKSTFLGVIKHLLGDYAVQGSPALLMAPDHGNGEELSRRQRAVVKGKRLVLVQEIEAGRYLNEAQVKQLTGGDVITAARLYENEVEIMPTHKIAVGTNYRPVVRGHDHGMWRRMRLVPFPSQIAEELKDPHLPAKLRAEASGILRWAVQGYFDMKRVGLRESPVMRAAAEGYRKAEDRLGEFLEDATVPGGCVLSSELFTKYQMWCSARGEKAWTQRSFSNALVEGNRGYKSDQNVMVNGHKGRGFKGLQLKP